MKRVAIIGSGGAGKSTFARALTLRTGLPLVHLDHLYWSPGWVVTPSDEWRVVLEEALGGDAWIADGNYARTYDVRFARADTIIVLAPSRWRCATRVLKRTFTNYGCSVQAPDCPERFDFKFLRWVWRYPTDSRPQLDAAIREHGADASLIELTTSRQVQRFLEALGPDTSITHH